MSIDAKHASPFSTRSHAEITFAHLTEMGSNPTRRQNRFFIQQHDMPLCSIPFVMCELSKEMRISGGCFRIGTRWLVPFSVSEIKTLAQHLACETCKVCYNENTQPGRWFCEAGIFIMLTISPMHAIVHANYTWKTNYSWGWFGHKPVLDKLKNILTCCFKSYYKWSWGGHEFLNLISWQAFHSKLQMSTCWRRCSYSQGHQSVRFILRRTWTSVAQLISINPIFFEIF